MVPANCGVNRIVGPLLIEMAALFEPEFGAHRVNTHQRNYLGNNWFFYKSNWRRDSPLINTRIFNFYI
ncbi:hypothetical protein RC74_17795 [Falsihalocynthiibacter arcticus]|uniref:Uncharacterized protein n=1 Tax=Falsihalocynthiibacter arcticus TaxID=1579316 RepID=A0A126V3H1_9RHOB|nr:hypothetical protein RC74_17795 [Falsihalocynthiibacter arcticus]